MQIHIGGRYLRFAIHRGGHCRLQRSASQQAKRTDTVHINRLVKIGFCPPYLTRVYETDRDRQNTDILMALAEVYEILLTARSRRELCLYIEVNKHLLDLLPEHDRHIVNGSIR